MSKPPGEASEIVDPARLADLDGRLPDLWQPLAAARVLSVPLQKLTGRCLRPAGPIATVFDFA